MLIAAATCATAMEHVLWLEALVRFVEVAVGLTRDAYLAANAFITIIMATVSANTCSCFYVVANFFIKIPMKN